MLIHYSIVIASGEGELNMNYTNEFVPHARVKIVLKRLDQPRLEVSQQFKT